jgi:hypothetical protein
MSFMLSQLSNISRSPGDPKVVESGPSSLKPADSFGRALGWFSMGLGLTELIAPKVLTRWLGVEGKEGLVRAYGAREIASGVMCLSVNNDFGAWSRAAGDMLDLASLAAAYRDDNPKKGNVGVAIAAIAGIAIVDALAGQAIRSLHSRKGEPVRDYSDRSGFPKGVGYSRGKASRAVPQEYQATPSAAAASMPTGETSPASADLILEVPV